MQGQDNNVVSIFEARKKLRAEEAPQKEAQDFSLGDMFADAIKRNEENKKKLQKERLQANKSVLKSYRIKD